MKTSDAVKRDPRPATRLRASSLLAGGILCAALGGANVARADIVSVSTTRSAGNGPSSGVVANQDGSRIAFYSDASDLVSGDSNEARDVFWRDRVALRTEFVSLSSSGVLGNLASHDRGGSPAISADGELIAFYSEATRLVANDTNGVADVFVRGRRKGTTERVSIAADGAQANGPSVNPSLDASGVIVAFQSLADNLVAADDNRVADIFVRNRATGATERACGGVQPDGGSFGPAVSGDGNFVAFTSAAANLVPGDTNRRLDVFVCDRSTGIVDRVSVNGDGIEGNDDSILPAISRDGRFVAFKSLATNLVVDDTNGVVDVFVRDRLRGVTERVSVSFLGGNANDGSFPPSISDDGRFVAFGSAANNLVRNDYNLVPSVFVRDLLSGVTLLVDVNDAGEQANGGTPDVPPALSRDGRVIGFVSFADNLSPRDGNQTNDVFVGRNPFFCDDTGICPDGFVCVNGFCQPEGGVPTRTPTRTPTLGPNDCCDCGGARCEATAAAACPAQCGAVYQAACIGGVACATFTPKPTPTPTPTFGMNDCCQCDRDLCSAATEAGCPFNCLTVRQASCQSAGVCVSNTPTPTATYGPNDCCQCENNVCSAATSAGCPASCAPVRQAACLSAGACATHTPTPTATYGPNDCCQCENNVCSAATSAGCPANCAPIRQAACLSAGACATHTPTPTATYGPNDCCECDNDVCSAATSAGCPANCAPVRQAACLAAGACATHTPTNTGTPATPTPTPTRTSVACPTYTPCMLGSAPVCPDPTNPCNCNCAPCPVPTCPGGGTCVFRSYNSCECSCEPAPTNTPTTRPAVTATTPPSTRPTTTPTATTSKTPGAGKDSDGCDCAISATDQRRWRGGAVWLAGVAALWLRRRRFRRG